MTLYEEEGLLVPIDQANMSHLAFEACHKLRRPRLEALKFAKAAYENHMLQLGASCQYRCCKYGRGGSCTTVKGTCGDGDGGDVDGGDVDGGDVDGGDVDGGDVYGGVVDDENAVILRNNMAACKDENAYKNLLRRGRFGGS